VLKATPSLARRSRRPAIAALAAATTGILSLPAFASDLTTVQQRISSSLISSDPSDSTVGGYISSEQSNGSWSDINYGDTSQTNWTPATALTRMLDMAESYSNSTSTYYQSASVKTDILNAFDYWCSVDPQSTNWYDNDIRTPQGISNTEVLMSTLMSPTELSNGETIMNRARSELSVPSIAQGSNLVLLATVGINQGIVDNNTSDISQGFNEIYSTVSIDSAEAGDGIQPDHSYHFHGNQLYEGDYGVTALTDPLEYASFAVGTSYAMNSSQQQILVDTLLDGSQWFVYGQSLDFTASGRDASRTSFYNAGTAYIGAIQYALSLGSYRQSELQAFLNRQNSAVSTHKANSSLGLTGNKVFPQSDIMVQQRPTYYESARVSSNRNVNPESINSENLKGLYMADGVNQIMVTGQEYSNIEPVWNWRRLPGTTVEQDTRSLQPGSADKGSTAFAGGVSDGTYGAEALFYKRFDISAQKSWFFFNNEEAALGAAITAPNAASEVDTTLNQCLLTSTVSYETSAGGIQSLTTGTVTPSGLKWVFQGSVGYFFPTPVSNATIMAGPQTGNWQSINSQYSNSTVTQSVFTLYMNEGTHTASQSYSYIVVPGITAASMDAYLASDPIQIIRNDANVQAIRQSAQDITQAAFYAPDSFSITAGQTISANAASMVMLQRQTNVMKLAASNPLNQPLTLQLQLTGVKLSGSGSTWFDSMGNAAATFNLPGGNSAGQTIGLTLSSDGATNPTVSLANSTGSGPLSYNVTATVPLTGHTTFQTDANSTLQFSAPITGSSSLTTAGSGTVIFAAQNTYAGPTNVNGGTLRLASSTGLATLFGLTIAPNATFDITNNHAILTYGSGSDPITTIAAYIASGYAGGSWTGPGIVSSTVATTPGYGIGYADSADPGNPAGLSSGTIEFAYTLLGDADLNGVVNGIDFGILAANFNKTASRWDQGDFDYNGIVNGLDFTDLAANFNKAASSASDIAALNAFAAANGLLADVPEPATFAAVLIPIGAFLVRRRKNQASHRYKSDVRV
jgi:autotransporter-associated beta strand protein